VAPARPATIDVFADVSAATGALARRDAVLGRACSAIAAPVIRRREGGFHGLFRIIVEQQVSVPSAQAIWKRCLEGVECASPAAVGAIGEDGLRALGLSTPKARYVVGLATAAANRAFDFDALLRLNDEDAMKALIELKGVGPWTAAIYLLFCEGRIDVWPPNDVALRSAYGAAANCAIDQKSLDGRAGRWAPWRGVAAHILWTYYAQLRGRTPI
jgi:DNA-3-methyladenine glycosylase II